MKNNALAYSLKVWLTAVFLGSALLAVFIGFQATPEVGSLISQIAFVMIITTLYGGAFSIPGLTILLLSSWGLCNVSLTNINRKLILTGIGVLSGLLAFFVAIWLDVLRLSDRNFTLPYFVTTIAGIWFYKLKTEKDEVDTMVPL